jgi:hypothetical protein
MAGYHAMTPARRAALRKAQLASAAKRRKYGVGSQVRRAGRQSFQRAGASAQVAARRHVGSKGFQRGAKKAAKYTAVGLGAAAVVGAGVVAGGHRTINNNIAAQGFHKNSRSGKVFRQNNSKIGRVVGTSRTAKKARVARTKAANKGYRMGSARATTSMRKGNSPVRFSY